VNNVIDNDSPYIHAVNATASDLGRHCFKTMFTTTSGVARSSETNQMMGAGVGCTNNEVSYTDFSINVWHFSFSLSISRPVL
jgi:hypothetical protein